jgi:phage terminase large subunit-like protein
MKDYAAIATQYARDVAEGKILACKWVRLACRRHLSDLERVAGGWRYTWNPELETKEGKKYRPADRVCLFIELLPHIKDDWRQSAARGARLILEPWQVFVVASVFGWVDRETKRRRFRVADLFVPRKNAKSTLAAAIGLYMLAADGEFGAEVYSGASSEKQAGEVFTPARLMVERTPEFRARFGVSPLASNITVQETNSKFERVIGKPGDGASPSCAIVDEYHEHPTEELFDTMRTGMGARSQPLMLVITTAGDDISGPCYAHQEALQQVLEGVLEDEQRFGLIFTVDEGDDWTSEAALIKANPNYAVSIDPEFLLVQQRDAVRDARKQPTFLTKHLNIWVQSSSPWLNMHDWKRLADKSLKREDFAGEPCWLGLDLANVTDIANVCTVFRRQLDGVAHYYAFWRHYLPAETIAEPENKHYQGWKREGWLTETDGSMIDQAKILADVQADSELSRVLEVAIDDWGSPGISAALENDGFTVARIPQKVTHLSAPMKFLDGLVQAGRLHHCGDPVAAWGVSNVQVKPDRNDNWFPRRGSRKKKIDPALALIMAMCRAMVDAEQPTPGIAVM